jgi:hypothetical protein
MCRVNDGTGRYYIQNFTDHTFVEIFNFNALEVQQNLPHM